MVKRWLKEAIMIIQKASDEGIVRIVECDPMERGSIMCAAMGHVH